MDETNKSTDGLLEGKFSVCRDSIFIKSQDYFQRIRFASMLYLEASGSYCNICLACGTRLTVSFTLSQVLQRLPEEMFVRVHRSFIVNMEYIDSYIGNLFYINGNAIPIGRSYRKDLLERLNILGSV